LESAPSTNQPLVQVRGPAAARGEPGAVTEALRDGGLDAVALPRGHEWTQLRGFVQGIADAQRIRQVGHGADVLAVPGPRGEYPGAESADLVVVEQRRGEEALDGPPSVRDSPHRHELPHPPIRGARHGADEAVAV
jgi:hypothetical protein